MFYLTGKKIGADPKDDLSNRYYEGRGWGRGGGWKRRGRGGGRGLGRVAKEEGDQSVSFVFLFD